jgi:hypothetical protein
LTVDRPSDRISSMIDVKKPVPAAVSSYMRQLGIKGGGKNKQKGNEYFKWVASHRKDVQKKRMSAYEVESNVPEE